MPVTIITRIKNLPFGLESGFDVHIYFFQVIQMQPTLPYEDTLHISFFLLRPLEHRTTQTRPNSHGRCGSVSGVNFPN